MCGNSNTIELARKLHKEGKLTEAERLYLQVGAVLVPVSAGELIDKLTILEIKCERMTDPAKLTHVRAELDLLEKKFAELVTVELDLVSLSRELKAINEKLWEVEDKIRLCEKSSDFGDRFVQLARSVYIHNDARFALKAKINQLLNSQIAEQKEYACARSAPT
jgi:hypothetical protein